VKRTLIIGVLAVLAFAIILIARLPASWVVPSPPSNIACVDTDGTIWSGECTGLTVQGQTVGDATWELRALPLLSGKVAGHIVLSRASDPKSAPAHAEADVETGFSGKNISARNVKADLSFDPAFMPQLHLPFAGSLHSELSQVQVKNGVITKVQGEVQVHDLHDRSDDMDLGSYSLTFPGGSGEQTARLKDLGGPLAVEGSVRFTNEPGVVVDGLVTARPTAPQDLQNQLRILGTPDAQGRRPFSFASTF
jgi:general secretion pathway protein N